MKINLVRKEEIYAWYEKEKKMESQEVPFTADVVKCYICCGGIAAFNGLGSQLPDAQEQYCGEERSCQESSDYKGAE